jgi:hypothetical protein
MKCTGLYSRPLQTCTKSGNRKNERYSNYEGIQGHESLLLFSAFSSKVSVNT